MKKAAMKGLYARVIKRLLDVLCSATFLLLFWWVYVILIILVKKKLGSPVFFKQDRPGRIDADTGKEKIFRLYKFRSMRDEMGENGKPLPDYIRLTEFGRMLRRTSLDELPEIWNILKGDMSIVGPRPWAIAYLPYYTDEERRRHLVRPGLSGWAQVNGRSVATWEQRIQSDLEYIDRISFLLDVKIIFLTVKQVLFRENIVDTAEEQGDFEEYRKHQLEEQTGADSIDC